MSSQNIETEVRQMVKDLMHIRSRVIPVKVGKEVVSSVRQNFRSGGFYGKGWQRTKRQEVPFKGAAGTYGPLLSKTTHLMSSTDYVPGDAQVSIRNTAPYAQYHNEGTQSTVTKKMKKFFWAKYYESGGGAKTSKGKKKKDNPEAEFWKAMALKKPGRKIKIPKRQFLGPSPHVDKMVKEIIDKEFQKYIDTHIK